MNGTRWREPFSYHEVRYRYTYKSFLQHLEFKKQNQVMPLRLKLPILLDNRGHMSELFVQKNNCAALLLLVVPVLTDK